MNLGAGCNSKILAPILHVFASWEIWAATPWSLSNQNAENNDVGKLASDKASSLSLPLGRLVFGRWCRHAPWFVFVVANSIHKPERETCVIRIVQWIISGALSEMCMAHFRGQPQREAPYQIQSWPGLGSWLPGSRFIWPGRQAGPIQSCL